MKRKWLGIKITAGICAALGWWGVLYPELTMTPDTYKIICEDSREDCQETAEWDFDSDVYQKLLEADLSQITFRSRLLVELWHLLPQEN